MLPAAGPQVTLLADAATIKALADHPLLGGPAPLRRALQHSVHYDTEAADLARHGVALALRRARGRCMLSLVARDGAFEVKASGEAAQIELLPAAARAMVARAAARKPLRPWFSMHIRRAVRLLAFEGVTIEAAFEAGEIDAGARKCAVREITLTLKAGEPAGLYRLALALLDVAPLSLGVSAKVQRGFALAQGDAGDAPRAQAPDFGAEATLDAALAGLLRQGLAHFLGCWPALDASDSAEAVHQIRVALRRLRSLLALLRKAFPAAEIDFLRAEAKRIADAFGPARDWRVFSDMVATGPAPRLAGAAGVAELIALAEARAETGRAQGVETLAAASTTRFALALHLYICARGWRNAAGEAQLRALGEPAADFAALALERLFRRVRRRAHGFDALSPPARHEMRIALKQLRYAVDFFGTVFRPGSAVTAFAEAASELQDLLGAANDAAVASDLVASIDVTDKSELAFAAGAVVGWRQHGGLVDEAALRRGWKALRRARRFWRPYLPADAPPEPAPSVGG
ncbi:MAG TPA: CHAD domain-containing protein [Roseiarcus sp.]|nr:CHAD domain-containing protein [Roseiarcus sp.]